MDSDSSLEGEDRNNGVSSRSWANRQNSDVSDDENFSRGAKSIESPPESPPRGGGNLDSPPASPAEQGRGASPEPQESESGASTPYRDSPRPPESPQSNYETNHKSHSIGSQESSPESPTNDYMSDDCRGPKSPPQLPAQSDSDHSDDDGRSNISSNSSIGSANSRRSNKSDCNKKPERIEIKSHAEDLSDVSDIESLGSLSDNEMKKDHPMKDENQKHDKEKKIGLTLTEETEQLDFEAEEDREEGECEGAKTGGGGAGGSGGRGGDKGSEDEGELKELEEGELTDEGENRPEETEPRPVCRFFSRGQCTWGSSCSFRHVPGGPGSEYPPMLPYMGFRMRRPWLRRGGAFFHRFPPRFVHPGVTDKGNYTMFDMVRPLVPMNSGPPHMYPGPMGPMDFHRPMDRPMMGPPPYQQPPIRKEEPIGESAWERGLRQAKELLRKSTKRKETEVDFEEKKMNLSVTQDEFDKENDYYTRSGSPYVDDHYDRYKGDGKRYRSVSERFADYGPAYYSRSEGWHYDERARYRSHHQDYPSSGDYYKTRHKYPPSASSREVIVQRSSSGTEKVSGGSWKDDRRHSERGSGGAPGRGDEWADPWMRSKSPTRKPSSRSRKKSYSSQSSYSSSRLGSRRSRRSFSNAKEFKSRRNKGRSSRSSSYSSYSRSRSVSRSSRSNSSRSRSRSLLPRKKVASPPVSRRVSARSPFSRGKVSPGYISEKRAETERSLHMNPPPPSPRGNPSSPSSRRNPTPPSTDRTKALAATAKRLIVAAIRERSASRSSSSGSDSSASSSDSSSDSVSSSSSSPPPPPRPQPSSASRNKRIVLDEKLAQAMKVKAMDALKLSGQKQQIKLTLKGREGAAERLQPPVVITGRKRPAESPPFDGDDSPSMISTSKAKKPAPSRREELLKQLKAVEDAIARKRSKPV